jgi:hypothetical protein
MCTFTFFIDVPEGHPAHWEIMRRLIKDEQLVANFPRDAEIVLRPLGSPTWEDASKLIFFTSLKQGTKILQDACVLDLDTWHVCLPSSDMIPWKYYLLEHLV